MKPVYRPAMSMLLFLVAITALAFSLYLDTLTSLHVKWTQWDAAYSHGYPLFLISLYYCCTQMYQQSASWRPRKTYALFALLPAVLWGYGGATQIQVLQQVSWPIAIFTLALPIVGIRLALRLIPVFLLMSLSIPIWDLVNPLLRFLTTEASTFLVRLVGITAYIDEFSFTLPYGTVVIAGSCSGLAFFMMALSLSGINAFYRRLPAKYAVISMLILVALAVVGNWLRVTALIMIAYYSKMQNSLVYDHGSFGWYIFAAIFFVYLMLIRNFPEKTNSSENYSVKPTQQTKNANPLAALVASVLVLLSLPLYMNYQNNLAPSEVVNAEYEAEVGFEAWLPHYTGMDAITHSTQLIDGSTWQYSQLAYYAQHQGKELVSDQNVLANDKVKQYSDVIQLDATPLVFSVIQNGSKARLVVWGYRIAGNMEVAAMAAKHAQFMGYLNGRTDVALVYLTRTCQTQYCESEKLALQANKEAWLPLFLKQN
ncbi:archaeosortase/exosortase family protein [Reinekea sp.]|jgi:exosortase|uniref:archaeosortase/exosortase family protein n=1 Tax=Reinekea sp. TaxID=1970455 RepID=UPI00398A0D07